MLAIDLFDLVGLFESRGVVTATRKNTAYCDCCVTRHVRQWYSVANTGDSFYICMHTGSVMVSTASGHWIQKTPLQLAEWLIDLAVSDQASPPAQQQRRKRLKRLFS